MSFGDLFLPDRPRPCVQQGVQRRMLQLEEEDEELRPGHRHM